MRVVVADDAMLIREGLTNLLREAGVTVVGKASNAEELMRHVRLGRPDVAVVDIRMPPGQAEEGLEAADRIRTEHPDTGVLLLSQYVNPRSRCACLTSTRRAVAICSKSACRTSRCSRTRCGGSPTASM
jgi:DNA-binding NarL/FixJ family response regulator